MVTEGPLVPQYPPRGGGVISRVGADQYRTQDIPVSGDVSTNHTEEGGRDLWSDEARPPHKGVGPVLSGTFNDANTQLTVCGALGSTAPLWSHHVPSPLSVGPSVTQLHYDHMYPAHCLWGPR